MNYLKVLLPLVCVGFLTVSCETPPPGTVVFEEGANSDEIVMDYLGKSEEDLVGHKVIKITTTAVRNPKDTTEIYVPHYERAANFK